MNRTNWHLRSLLIAQIVAQFLGCSSNDRFAPAGLTPDTSVNSPHVPRLRLVTHDFGIVLVGTTNTHEFVLTNSSAEPMQIREIRSSCRCTRLRHDEAPIPPGGTTTVSVEYRAPESPIDDRQVASVYFDAPAFNVQLVLTASVRRPLTTANESLQALWTDGKWTARTIGFNYTNSQWDGLTVVPHVDDGRTHANIRSIPIPASSDAVQAWSIELLYSGDEYPPQSSVQSLSVQAAGTANASTMVRLVIPARPFLSPYPKRLFLGRVHPGDPINASVRIATPDMRPEQLQVTIQSEIAITSKWEWDLKGDSAILLLAGKVDKEMRRGQLTGSVSISKSDNPQLGVSIPITGWVD